MKSTGIKQFFLIYTFFCFGYIAELRGQSAGDLFYLQDFENEFSIGEQVEFLPGWWGNEVNRGASRIYQASSAEARSGNAALAVVPTSTFTGELIFHFDASGLATGELSFWASSGSNGSGTRPSVVSLAFSADSGQTYIAEQEVGEAFPNADSPYQQYRITLPDAIAGQAEALFRIRIGRGAGGAGAAARVFIDDLQISRQPVSFRLLSANARSQEVVQLLFNKEPDISSAREESNFLIDKDVMIRRSGISAADPKKIELEVSAMKPGETYTVTIQELLDNEGNSAAGQEVQFSFVDTYELQTYDLLISEIHAAPNDETLLPNIEWVEVFNASGRTLSLEGLQLRDESRSASLPAYSLGAGEYLLLTAAADSPLLEEYGKVAGLSSWPNLNNGGDILSLYSPGGKLLDRVGYSTSWYNSSQKSQGGWSLERIDLANPCLGGGNWSAATAHSGGTPGRENSIAAYKPDLTGPEMLQAFVMDSLRIQLVFNELVDTSGLAVSNFILRPSLTVEKVNGHPVNPERLVLQLEEPLDRAQEYILTVDHIKDCSGNFMQEGFSQTALAFPVTARKGDVLLNEIMYNPLANSDEWIEIVNASEKHLNLQDWQLATYEDGIKSSAVLSRDFLIIAPGDFLVVSRQAVGVQGAFPSVPMEKVLQVEGLPQLPNSGDSIALISEDGEIHDLLGYSDGLHSPFLSDTKGVSLERIYLEAATGSPASWTSASEASGGGTPGRVNSQHYVKASPQEEDLIVEPAVIIPNGTSPPNFATIYFKSSRPALQVSLSVFDTQGRKIRNLANHQLLGTDTKFTWDGANESRDLVKAGYYIILMHVYNASGYSREFKKVVVVGGG